MEINVHRLDELLLLEDYRHFLGDIELL
ncbi:unnamed protein product, partial [Rotaria magnacalcarata]